MLSIKEIIDIITSNNLLKIVDFQHLSDRKKEEYWFKIEFLKPIFRPDFSQELSKIIKLGFYVSAFKRFDKDPENVIQVWFTKLQLSKY